MAIQVEKPSKLDLFLKLNEMFWSLVEVAMVDTGKGAKAAREKLVTIINLEDELGLGLEQGEGKKD